MLFCEGGGLADDVGGEKWRAEGMVGGKGRHRLPLPHMLREEE